MHTPSLTSMTCSCENSDSGLNIPAWGLNSHMWAAASPNACFIPLRQPPKLQKYICLSLDSKMVEFNNHFLTSISDKKLCFLDRLGYVKVDQGLQVITSPVCLIP